VGACRPSDVFAAVQRFAAEGLSVRDWGVSHVTLEDVFHDVATSAGVEVSGLRD